MKPQIHLAFDFSKTHLEGRWRSLLLLLVRNCTRVLSRDEISRVLKITDGVMRHMATRRIAGSGKNPPPPPPPVAESVPSREYSGERSNRRSNEDEEEE